MDFVQSHYYKETQTLLSLLGQWPYQKRGVNYLCRCFILFVFSQSIFFQVITIYKSKFDMQITFNVWPILMTIFALSSIAIASYINEDQFLEMWKRMKSDWALETSEEENKIKEEIAEYTKRGTIYFIYIGVVGLSIFVIISAFFSEILDLIMPLNETRNHIHPFMEYVFIDKQKYFYLLFFKYQVTTILGVAFAIGNFNIFFIYIQHANGMFRALCYRLENLVPNFTNEVDYQNPAINIISQHSLQISIERHQKALEFAALLESYYASAFAIFLVLSVLILSPTLVQIAEVEEVDYKTILSVIIMGTIIFLFNFFGQKQIDISTEVAKRAYMSRWYLCSPKAQSMLIVLIRRSEVPCTISCYSLFVASLDCFRMVLQTIISYFMAIRNLKG